MKAFLILEDGTIFEGTSIGVAKETISEIVFNTSMMGYLEVLTDPSYESQSVCMTYPLIGNYGVNHEDQESGKAYVKGFIVKELAKFASNYRNEGLLNDFLVKEGVTGIEGVDTRKLTKILRSKGTMNGMITTNCDFKLDEILPQIKAYKITNAVKNVTNDNKQILPGDGYKVALLDLGAKGNIEKVLNNLGCQVTIYPAFTSAEEILSENPDGIMISNGPGDPKELTTVIKEVKKLFDSNVPMFAICLGHQLLALATGADCKKLKYGHHGGNHPVIDVETKRVYITSQNHNYYVDEATLDPKVAKPLFVNVNDNTNEGLRYIGKNVFTVQFHPEACPGPTTSSYLFDDFIKIMGGKKNA